MSLISAYVEVILPLPLQGTFTYAVPEALRQQVQTGSRVIVPFGKRKFYTAIVAGFAAEAPREYEIKEIISVLDSHPVLRHPQLRFWEWMADYYLCSVGDVYKAAVPAGLKIESETCFEANPDFEMSDIGLLSEREAIVLQQLESKGKMPVKQIEKETGFRNLGAMLQRMVERGAAIVSETLVERFRPKKIKYVRIALPRGDNEAMRGAFEAVRGAKKQESLLLTLIHMSHFNEVARSLDEVPQDDLLEKAASTATILKALADKGLVERYTRETSRFAYAGGPQRELPTLSEPQSQALQDLHKAFFDKQVALLHGVTSSGKTEIYMHLIQYALDQGMQCLYLVPEIALTTQLTARLQSVFGQKVVIYHSKFSDNERVEIWQRLLRTNDPCVVIGARSAVFLPMAKLGLVIVDEEHDPSYKQFDPAPRYNGRDSAIMLAHMHGAKVVLGSATPSVETYYKALAGKYGLAALAQRYSRVELPEILIEDMARQRERKAVDGSFANDTITRVRHALRQQRQAIIFHNRRGFAPMARCTRCQYIPKCQYCDVSLTYHKRVNALMCHYCGAAYPMPDICPACKEPTIEVVGYGTERVEDEVERIFPEARVMRMDLDTTRNKSSHSTLIDNFSSGKADILVGTQMVTKGLDFGAVDIVVVVNADSLIHYPDFHSSERAFDMLEQVAGRAGRRSGRGVVVIQTREPKNWILECVQRHDYQGFYEREIEERRLFVYPPYVRVINIILRHKDDRELDSLAQLYGAELRRLFGTRVSGPTRPPVARVQSLYIRQLMLKVELSASMPRVKEILRQAHASLCCAHPAMRHTLIHYDVDPY